MNGGNTSWNVILYNLLISSLRKYVDVIKDLRNVYMNFLSKDAS